MALVGMACGNGPSENGRSGNDLRGNGLSGSRLEWKWPKWERPMWRWAKWKKALVGMAQVGMDGARRAKSGGFAIARTATRAQTQTTAGTGPSNGID